MGWGGIIVDQDTGEVLHQISGYKAAEKENTNNVAEYMALLALLAWLYKNGHTDSEITIKGDSQLVIKQMAGEWGMNRGAYINTARRCLGAIGHFSTIHFQHVYREYNQEADDLSKSELTKRGIQEGRRVKKQ